MTLFLLILNSLLPNAYEISYKNVCLKISIVKVSTFIQYQYGSIETKCFLILRPVGGIWDCSGVDMRQFCMVQTSGFVD